MPSSDIVKMLPRGNRGSKKCKWQRGKNRQQTFVIRLVISKEHRTPVHPIQRNNRYVPK